MEQPVPEAVGDSGRDVAAFGCCRQGGDTGRAFPEGVSSLRAEGAHRGGLKWGWWVCGATSIAMKEEERQRRSFHTPSRQPLCGHLLYNARPDVTRDRGGRTHCRPKEESSLPMSSDAASAALLALGAPLVMMRSSTKWRGSAWGAVVSGHNGCLSSARGVIPSLRVSSAEGEVGGERWNGIMPRNDGTCADAEMSQALVSGVNGALGVVPPDEAVSESEEPLWRWGFSGRSLKPARFRSRGGVRRLLSMQSREVADILSIP